MKISRIKARQILDSRGNPTVEVDLFLESGAMGRAAVPSGASCGENEALEMRDGGTQYGGKGVMNAIENINAIISPSILGNSFSNQRALDNLLIELDGTNNKSRLGANAILGISLAYAKACAKENNSELYRYIKKCYEEDGVAHSTNQNFSMPRPMINIINGGSHADNKISFQEFMICPSVSHGFQDAMMQSVEIFHTLKQILKQKGYNTNIGDEGGYAPALSSCRHALDFLLEAINKAGYRLGTDINIALDIAANEFFDTEKKKYILQEEGLELTGDELILFYETLLSNYPIISMEDPFQENDLESWTNFTKQFSNKVQIVGDDIFVTNVNLLQQGINKNIANAILIKPNQIGTLTETIDAIKLANQNNYNTIISHRSGETEDTTISHMATALSNQIKTGSVCRTDRVCKYNELIRIEEQLLNANECNTAKTIALDGKV